MLPKGMVPEDQALLSGWLRANLDSYLGRTRNEVLNIPQVVIDRAGMIRAASSGRGGDPQIWMVGFAVLSGRGFS